MWLLIVGLPDSGGATPIIWPHDGQVSASLVHNDEMPSEDKIPA